MRNFPSRHRSQLLLTLLGIAVALSPLSSREARGQGDPTTATLTGVISDPSGARIPNAMVTLKSTGNGVNRTTKTDAHGGYAFQVLPPSTYELVVSAANFRGYDQKGISLDAGRSAQQDISLTIGSEDQKVEVTAEAPLINTDNANISADIAAKQIVELPLNLRNIIGLTELNSSVNNTTQSQVLNGGGASTNGNADQDISFLNFSGGFFGTTAFLLDGVWDTSGDWGASIFVPSVDAVEEFKIQNNSFTAQYGWSTGNVVNIVTKSGTSKFHGSAYEFYRNSALDANLYFANHNGDQKPDFDRNQFGVSAGGPLYLPYLYKQHEKTFIFGLYEHLHSSTPSLATNTVPTSSFLSGDFSALLGAPTGTDYLGRPVYSGQIYDPNSARQVTNGQTDPRTGLVAKIPGGGTAYLRDPIAGNKLAGYAGLPALNAQAVKILSYYPKATNSQLTNNFTASGSSLSGSNEYLIRVDHNLTNAARLFFRYSYKQEFKTGTPEYWGNDPGGPGNNRPNNRYNVTAGYSQVIAPTLVMNINAGFEHWGEQSTNQGLGFKPSTLGLPASLDGVSGEFPNINVGSQTSLGPTGGAENTAYRPTGSLAVDFTKTAGRHTLSFGFMGVVSEDNSAGLYQTSLNFNGNFTQGPDPDAPASNTGNGVAQMLFGVLDGGNTGVAFNPAITKKYLGGYLQDDWKVMSKLTLNLGLREEIQTAPTYRHNTAAFFDPNQPNPIGMTIGQAVPGSSIFTSPDHRGVYDTNLTNIAPRVGFSYHVLPKIVIRGGYGIFYPPSAYLGTSSTDGFSTSTDVIAQQSGSRVPNPSVSISNPWYQGLRLVTGNSQGMLQNVGFGVSSTFRTRDSSYVQQYMFGVQYAFTNSDVLDITYIGNRGTHLVTGGLNRDQLNPTYLSLGATGLNNLVNNPYAGAIQSGQTSCSLDQTQVSFAQVHSPFSQFCSVTENQATFGSSNYNALQVNFNHRFSQGLNLLVSYTYSKFLDNIEGTNSWAYSSNAGPANNYNLAAEKSIDSGDIPNSLVVNYIYDLPVGRGKRFGSNFNRTTNAVLGGWEVSGITTVKSGIPLGVTGSNWNSFGGNPRPDVTGDPKLSHRTITEWFNTGAFSYAPYGSFGTAPRNFSDLRGPNYQNWDLALLKNWKFTEGTKLQFRAEMFNAFNHANFYTPNTGYGGCDPNASSSCNSSFGQITSTFPARDIQLAGKFYW
jgi:hypothetical protein